MTTSLKRTLTLIALLLTVVVMIVGLVSTFSTEGKVKLPEVKIDLGNVEGPDPVPTKPKKLKKAKKKDKV